MTKDEETWTVDSSDPAYKSRTIFSGYLWDDNSRLPVHRKLAYVYALKHDKEIGHDEHVHHINAIKTDNDPNNLIILHKWIHFAIHAALMVIPYMQRAEISTMRLRTPESLVALLKEAGVPYMWLGDE